MSASGGAARTAVAAPQSPIRGRVVVIANPATRRDAGRVIDLIQRAAPAGVTLDVRLTRGPGDAVSLARDGCEGAALVVAVGGDGTVADVATGILGSGAPLGIVPAGSTNIVARELGIPTASPAAAQALFAPHRLVARDVGRCGDRCFLHMAGAGLDSRFFAAANPALKRRVGWPAYLPAAARALRLPPAHFDLISDDHRLSVTSPLVLVANGGSVIAPWLRLDPAITATDGWLDLLVFTAVRPLPIANTLVRFAARRLPESPWLLHLKTRRVEMLADPPLPVEFDGDIDGSTPAVFTVDPLAIRVVVPLG